MIRALPTLTLLLLLFLAGCAASGPKVGEGDTRIGPPPVGKARIVFYRSTNPFLLALEPQIVVNDLAVGNSIRGAAFYKDARPGRYKVFLADDPDNPVYLILASGDTAFVKVEPVFDPRGSKLTASHVDAGLGRQEVQGLALNDGLDAEL